MKKKRSIISTLNPVFPKWIFDSLAKEYFKDMDNLIKLLKKRK